MIEEDAQVIALNGKDITLQAQPSSACTSCQAKNSCGQGLLSRYFNQNPGQIVIKNALLDEDFKDLKVGDRVLIGIEESAILRGAFYAYMLPLLSMVAFAILTQAIGVRSEFLQILLTISGLFLGISVSRFLLSNTKSERRHLKQVVPTLLKKYPRYNTLGVIKEIV